MNERCVCGHKMQDHAVGTSAPWCLVKGGCDCHEYEPATKGLHPCAGCGLELDGDDPSSLCGDCNESEGWSHYAAEQERHAETRARLDLMTREARLSREATEKAVGSRVARHEVERAFRAAAAPEDSMATDDDLLRYEGRAEAVAIMRDMLGLVGDVCRAPGYNGQHVAVGAGAVGAGPYVCHGCGGTFMPDGSDA